FHYHLILLCSGYKIDPLHLACHKIPTTTTQAPVHPDTSTESHHSSTPSHLSTTEKSNTVVVIVVIVVVVVVIVIVLIFVWFCCGSGSKDKDQDSKGSAASSPAKTSALKSKVASAPSAPSTSGQPALTLKSSNTSFKVCLKG